jgi:HSP20 family protein
MAHEKNKDAHLWHPIEDIRSLAENMSRAYDSAAPSGSQRGFWPGWNSPEQKLALVEDRGGFILTVELPMVAKKDLHVSVAETAVTVFARWTKESRNKNSTGKEQPRVEQHYSRVIQLPAPVKVAEVRASFRDRVLKIFLPRIAPSKVRRIDVE